ncbi:Aste57867_2524 [Aphanomyces stellatus]|uniref:Aste57867_2524 protein n=1 Tax=Aphanomyces stellatus TaxID=120398 RepID=A0A485KAA5_9STRA|nr:hypothetical protein As57867_002517 [Aphanomyces stellatus]VFT79723.1 Aste57867_2524 [Aphanomyces stellatus]
MASAAVLFCSDLSSLVTSFQRGIHEDMKIFRTKLCPVYAAFYDPALIRPRMTQTHAILGPWFDQHGLTRLDKMLTISNKMQQVVVQYAVYQGRVDIAQYMHAKYDLLSYKENLLDFAALNDQVPMLAYLQSIGHVGQTDRALLWAAQFGHVKTVRFLVQVDPTGFPWSDAIQVAQKHGHMDVARFLQRPKALPSMQKRAPATGRRLTSLTSTRTLRV